MKSSSILKTAILMPLLLVVANCMCAQNGTLTGGLPAAFSVSATKKVYFSQGNLQCHISADDNFQWEFADEQYEIIGSSNEQSFDNNNGWIDLFAYGTSGWNSGAIYYKPNISLSAASASSTNQFLRQNLTGQYANADWGIYNKIQNGGDTPGYWRTLTIDEWNYLIKSRNNASNLCKYARIDVGSNVQISGILIFPDTSTISNQKLNSLRTTTNNSVNVYTLSVWKNILESGYHAVFLPEAGNMEGGTFNTDEGDVPLFKGCYWSSTVSPIIGTNGTQAYPLRFYNTIFGIRISTNALGEQRGAFRNFSVRLVFNGHYIQFKNYDGTLLCDGYFVEGTTPDCSITPTKPSTSEYKYIFKGWTCVPATKDTVYVAQYDSTKNEYEIVWKNWNGDTLCFDTITYGETPEYCGIKTPEKIDPTNEWTYTFKGWTPEVTSVTGEADYVATFDSIHNKYQVTWVNYNDTVLYKDSVIFGNVPVYPYDDPECAATAQYTYQFSGWIPAVGPVTQDTVFKATYRNITVKYLVTWKNDNDTVLTKDSVEYGMVPSYTGETPTKNADAQFTYTFKGWNPKVDTVKGAQTYLAEYNETLNYYKVVYVNYNLTDTLFVDTLAYGTTPVYGGETPTKPADVQNTYQFVGWDPDETTVTQDTVYVAVFDVAGDVEYVITWANYDGTKIYTDTLSYDDLPFYDQTNYGIPQKPSTDKYHFVWNGGWTPAVSNVRMNKTYTATFDTLPHKYEITWYNYDSTVLRKDSIIYDTMPVYTGQTPVKDATLKFTYLFLNQWNPAIQPVKKDTGYVAVFDSLLNSYKIVWKNWNDTILHTSTHNYGDTIIAPANPVRTTETDSVYFFIGWIPDPVTEVNHVNGIDTMFVAQYENKPRYYDVTIVLEDSTTHITGEYDSVPELSIYQTTFTHCDSTYTFDRWTPEIAAQDTTPVTYTAVYNVTQNLYTMTWVDSAGINTYRQPYDSLLTIQQTADTVLTDNFIWLFDGWDPTPMSLNNKVPCNDTTFEAKYHNIPRYYDVTYIYRDENIAGKWDTTIVQHRLGDILVPDSLETERRYCDSTYIFQNWNPLLEQVNDTSAKIFIAQYVDSANLYNVVWKNWDGTILNTNRLEYQDPISAPTNPTRPADATNVYFFAGWNPDPTTQLTNVPCHDTSFVAQYTSVQRYYDVTIMLEDSTTHIVGEYDSVPNLSMYETTFVHCDSTYTFHHWTPALHAQGTTSDTYTAVYTVTVNKYYVTWSDYDGTTLRVDTLECGDMPTYTPDPTRPSDCDNDYAFAAWSPIIAAVTQNVTYTATYTATLRDYYVTWKNWNDTVLRIDTVHCSDMPTFTPDPYKLGDSQIAYKFNSWTPNIIPVSGDAEYIAQYDSAEAYIVYDSISYLECFGTVLRLPNGGYYSVKNDTVLIVHKHFNVIPFPETGDILDCDSIFTVNITVYKKPDFDMSLIACPEAILGTPIVLDQTTSDILSFFTGEEDQVNVVDSWWEIYEQRQWRIYDGHRILSKDPIKLRFYIATEPCGDTLHIDYPSDECTLEVKDANADNCEDCNEIDCVDALYDWLLIYKNSYMRDTLEYDVPSVSVTWYKVQGDVDDLREPESCDDKLMNVGYYLTIDQNLKATGDYYALVDARNCRPDTLPCRGIMRSHIFHYQGAAHIPSVSLIPTEIEPQGLLTISGLDPVNKTQIYVYDMAGKMILVTNVQSDTFEFVVDAPDGVYRVLVLSDNTKETLIFIVK